MANIIMQQEWVIETYAISMQYNTNKNDVMQNLETESVIYKDSYWNEKGKAWESERTRGYYTPVTPTLNHVHDEFAMFRSM